MNRTIITRLAALEAKMAARRGPEEDFEIPSDPAERARIYREITAPEPDPTMAAAVRDLSPAERGDLYRRMVREG